MKNKKFVELERINFPIARSSFFYKVSKKKKGLACGCGAVSFIVPDFSIGLVMAMCVLSPIGFRKSFVCKVGSVKDWVVRKYYKMRLRL